jgi:hypothetical protein
VPQHFDVCVLGTQLSGLVAAALLARRGCRVLLVDHEGQISPITAPEGALADPSQGKFLGQDNGLTPFLVEVEPQHSTPHVQRICQELGLPTGLRSHLMPLQPPLQVLLKKHRLSLGGPAQRLIRECRLEFPELQEVLEQFFTQLFALDARLSAVLRSHSVLRPRGLWPALKHYQAMRRLAPYGAPFSSHALFAALPQRHPMRQLLLQPLSLCGYLHTPMPSTLHAVRLLARYFRGTAVASAGGGGHEAVHLEAARRNGVEVRPQAQIASLSTRGRRLHSLSFVGDRPPVTADHFVDALRQPLSELVDAGKAPRRRFFGASALAALRQCEEAAGPTHVLLAWHLRVRAAGVPRGMGQAVWVLDDSQQGERAQPLLLQRLAAPPEDSAAARSDRGGPRTYADPGGSTDCADSDAHAGPSDRTQCAGGEGNGAPGSDADHAGLSGNIDSAGGEVNHSQGDALGPGNSADQELLVVHCPAEIGLLERNNTLKVGELRLQVFARLRQVMPFLDDHLVSWWMPLGPLTAAAADLTPKGTAPRNNAGMTWHLQPLYRPKLLQGMGLMGRSVQTPFQNLLRCGRDVLPGLGLEGEYMTAGHVAQWLQQAVGSP